MKQKQAQATKEFKPSEIEPKWQEIWQKDKIYSPDMEKARNPFYNLMMFPYPSAEGMHVGNMYAFSGADVYGRFQRMQGKAVFEPIGLDGFGIHSENYALKVGKHPMEQADVSEKNFYRQMRAIGNSFDWTRTVETYKPDYYKWTQWLFIQMFKAGLAYRKKAEVNWCPSCKTVLADEQVIAGECERCGTVVEKRFLEQWFFKITEYAERLLNNIEDLNWSEKVKIAQRNWIGKSEGLLITFPVKGLDYDINVFTKFPETIYGVTYMVLAPEHPLVSQLTTPEQKAQVEDYVTVSKSKSDIERTAEGKTKTGVFTGSYVVNPVNGKEVPVWIADYVLAGYGTGAVMGVPASDHRDFAFAKKYELPIIRVIGKDSQDTDEVDSEDKVLEEGVLVNSDKFSGLETPKPGKQKVIEYLIEKGWARKETQYHLRDWLISRQRYWGPPIPMIYCEDCSKAGKSWFTTVEGKKQKVMFGSDSLGKDTAGWYPTPDKDLPVTLPKVEEYKPLGTGKAPLANYPEFYETTCPECGEKATRETDVSDTFLDSAWYFFRYTSTDIQNKVFDIERIKKWLPVNIYIGGAEHSVLHLLYSRFFTMFLRDLGLIEFDEPFSQFFAHGLIVKDGAKMSKSKGNVVVPDEYITKYGADTLRTYLMFLGPFSEGGDFRDTGIEGMYKFMRRVWTLLSGQLTDSEPDDEHKRMMHKTIKKVTEDLAELHYNTAIAALMEWYNFLSANGQVSKEEALVFLQMIAPFAPHMSEELWNELGREGSIHTSIWPEFKEEYLKQDEVLIVVQVNGKVRDQLTVESEKAADQASVEALAKQSSRIQKYLEGKDPKKVIYVPGKVLNFVI